MSSTVDVFRDSGVRIWLGDNAITLEGEVRITSPHDAAVTDVEIVIPLDVGLLGEEVTVAIPRRRLIDHLNDWWHTVAPRFNPGDPVWMLTQHGQVAAVVESPLADGVWAVKTEDGLTRCAGRFLTPRQES